MRTSLIIASYNQPRSLALVLEAVAGQTRPADEIIIADDGSKPPTFEVIERCRQQFKLPITAVVTQEDRGFRKSIALNKAVLKSTGQQLLFLDGDVIPPPHWVEQHAVTHRPMGYGIGTYIRLDAARSNDIESSGIENINWPVIDRQARRDWGLIKRNIKTDLYIFLRKSNKPKIWGGNLSVDRGLFFSVNGFDERYCGFGGEDSDLRNRMNNRGACPVNLVFSTLAMHLHPGFENKGATTESNLNRETTGMSVYRSSKKSLWADEGLTSHIKSATGT